MKTRKLILQVLSVMALLAALIFAGCKGDQGLEGPAGRNPEGAPVITAILASPDSVGGGGATHLLVAAYDPNGDTMSYVWSASAGTFTTPYASTTVWTAPQNSGVITLLVTVTARGGSAHDSVLVGVNMRVPTAGQAYLGDNGAACLSCHAGITNGWLTTGHAGAWAALGASDTSLYCQQCHTVGFDDKYSFGDHLISHGSDTTGYDNTHATSLQNVQCESCHGAMGPAPLNHAPQPLTDIVNGNKCSQCHHQNAEWALSGHGTAVARAGGQSAFLTEWGGSGCNSCHTSEGFITGKDPNFPSTGLPIANGINCATCHDPHNKTNDMQLRTIADVQSPYGGSDMPSGYAISGLGYGQLCAQCHHARRSQSQIMSQLTSGSTHPGPHDSPQSDMVSGRGDYEVAGDVNRINQHSTSDMPDMCVSCHMYTIPADSVLGIPADSVFGHKFVPDIRKCQTCHPGATNFDIGGVQTQVTMLMDSLKALLPHDSTGNVPSVMDTVNWTRAQRESGYTYYFVSADGSHGVHNRNYTVSILRNAVQWLSRTPN